MYNEDEFRKKIALKKETKKETHLTFKSFLFNALVKTLLVVIVFLGCLIFIKQNDKNKNLIEKTVYKSSLSFAKIYSVYEKYLGDVIPFQNTKEESVKMVSDGKLAYSKVVKEDNGYNFTVSKDYALSALKSGIVISMKKTSKYGKMIIIQDKNGLNITYGNLSNVKVKLYSYVKKGELIGTSDKTLYLFFEKNGKYLSYEKYI